MYKKAEELLTDDFGCKVNTIACELDECQNALSQLDREEEDYEQVLLGSKKYTERIYECWTGPRADHAVAESIDACHKSMVQMSNLAEEIRNDLKSEIERLNRHRDSLLDELNRVNHGGNDQKRKGGSEIGEEDDINVK